MNAPALRDQSDIAALVDRARQLFDEGDVITARLVASVAYDEAARAGKLAEKVKASERLMDKARRLQADALLIEHRCKVTLADLYDAAQESGAARKGGRPSKTVSDENSFSAEDVGLTRGEIHEARKLRDAERREPGIVERAIQARIEAGLAPTKAAVKHAIGTKTASKEERGDNHYPTPLEGIRTLMARERFLPVVLEPSCGRGAISSVMEAAGYQLVLSDLNDYETATRHGECQHVADFLTLSRDDVLSWTDGADFDLVTNPPYGESLNAYVAHALRRIKPRKMALLLNLNFLCGHTSQDRAFARDAAARVIVNAHRLPMMHRDGYDGDKASSQMNTMWMIWERGEDGFYAGPAVLSYADFSEHMAGPVMGPVDWADAPDASGVSVEADEDFTRETPRKTVEERVAELMDEAYRFALGRNSLTIGEIRRGLGVRDSVAVALMLGLVGRGMFLPEPDADGCFVTGAAT